MNKTIKIIISMLGGLYGTAYIISFFYWFITTNIIWFAILSIPFFSCLIGGTIYLSIKDK
jgi:hypothetical protein